VNPKAMPPGKIERRSLQKRRAGVNVSEKMGSLVTGDNE
jgi:hypothetical protein